VWREGGPSGSRNQSDGKAEKHGRTRRAVIGWVAGCGSVAWFVSASGTAKVWIPAAVRSSGSLCRALFELSFFATCRESRAAFPSRCGG
jgi:hypothetical protein